MGAILIVETMEAMPPPPASPPTKTRHDMTNEIGGRVRAKLGSPSARRGATTALATNTSMPVAAPMHEIASGSDAEGEERGAAAYLATSGRLPLALPLRTDHADG